MTSWSFSAYSFAVTCLRKYKLCFIDKIPTPGGESGDLLFGSAIHSAINAVLTGQDGAAIFSIYWESCRGQDVGYGRYDWSYLKELGEKFVSRFEKLHAKKYEMEKGEVRLYGEYRGVKLEGTMDFYGKYEGKTSLRDFKTSGYNYDKAKKLIALQLNLYTYLGIVNGLTPPDTLGYTVFNKGMGSIQDLTWKFDEKAMFSHLDDLVSYCQTLEKVDAHPRNPNACIMGASRCGYFDLCWGVLPAKEKEKP